MNPKKENDIMSKILPFLATEEYKEIVPPVIYHYCSVESFMSIIKNAEMWASHNDSLNDYSESRLFFNVLYEVAQKKADSKSIELINRFLHNFEINLKDYYIASFSKEPDILSQWYMYANKGKGVCIGFNTSSFNIPTQIPYFSDLSGANIGMFNVSYQNEKQEELASDLVDLVIDGIWGDKPPNVEKLSLVMKHSSFEQEQEVRIVEVQNSNSIINPDAVGFRTLFPGDHYSFREKNENSIVSFRKFPFGIDKSHISINSLWLGPECQINMKALSLFLNSTRCTIDDKVYKSRCPFQL
jgi:hypothetical protein